MTLSEAKYLTITGNVLFVPPLNPPLQPKQAVGVTGPQITEVNRLHLELKQTFQTYQAIDQALRNLILAAVPPIYVNFLSHNITGFANLPALTIMTSLPLVTIWQDRAGRTRREHHPNEHPIEDIFHQLTRGSQFASNGSDPIALSQVLCIGYTLGYSSKHAANGAKFPTSINMSNFQDLFNEAEQDHSSRRKRHSKP